MTDIVIKRHSFDLAQKRLKEFSEKTEAQLEIDRVRTSGGFLGLGDHKVTGDELNKRLKTIQSHFITVNETNNNVIKEFREVYNALNALDKEYIASILANVKAIEKTSNDVRSQQKKLEEHHEELKKHQTEIEDSVKTISKIVQVLKNFKAEIEALPDLLRSASETESALDAHTQAFSEIWQSLEDTNKTVTKISDSLSKQIERIEALYTFVDGFNSGLYWYRLLYNNPFFAKHISLDYWDREYDWRCQAIKELSQSLPVEERISFLKDMLSTLDIKISYVLLRRKQIKENSSNKKSSAKRQSSQRTKYSFLYSFPMQLINELRKPKRTKNTVPSNQRKEYFIPNPRLEIDNPEIRTMENAFPLMLSSHVNESTRAYIRSVYLDQICTTPTKSTFQKECEELQAYLNLYSTSPEKQQKYKEYAQHYCLRYYCQFWYSSPPLRDAFSNYPTNKLALDRLMDNIIGSYYRTYLEKVNSTAYIIQVYLNNPVEQCKYRHLSYKYIAFDTSVMGVSSTQCHAPRLSRTIVPLCEFSSREKASVLKNSSRFFTLSFQMVFSARVIWRKAISLSNLSRSSSLLKTRFP